MFFLAQKSAHIVERRVLALLLEHKQHFADELACLGVDEDMSARLFVVVVGRGVGVFVALIDLAGGDTVAEHLGHVLERHFAPAHEDLTVVADAVVDPVFKVMAVAPLVVEPGEAHAVFAPLGVVRAAVALIILDAAPEFRGAVLAYVMRQPLIVQAEAKTVLPHQMAMMRDGLKMLDGAHTDTSPAYSGRPPAAVRRSPCAHTFPFEAIHAHNY